jgi:hypothetical protein
VVEGEAQLQQQPALEEAAGDRRGAGCCTDGTEDDGLARREFCHHGIGQDLAGAQPALGAQVVVHEIEGVVTDDGGEDLQALSDHLRADAVAGDDRDDGRAGVCWAHPREATCRPPIGQFRLTESRTKGGSMRPCP